MLHGVRPCTEPERSGDEVGMAWQRKPCNEIRTR